MMRKFSLLLALLSLIPLSGINAMAQMTNTVSAGTVAPPAAKRVPKTTTIHGETLTDDYFWLREKTNPEVISHLEAENAYTDAVMKPTAALQEKLYQEMLGRIKQTDTNVPYRENGYYYYSRTVEGQRYPVYARKKGSLEAPEEV